MARIYTTESLKQLPAENKSVKPHTEKKVESPSEPKTPKDKKATKNSEQGE